MAWPSSVVGLSHRFGGRRKRLSWYLNNRQRRHRRRRSGRPRHTGRGSSKFCRARRRLENNSHEFWSPIRWRGGAEFPPHRFVMLCLLPIKDGGKKQAFSRGSAGQSSLCDASTVLRVTYRSLVLEGVLLNGEKACATFHAVRARRHSLAS